LVESRREKKEASKTIELQKKPVNELTQQAAAANILARETLNKQQKQGVANTRRQAGTKAVTKRTPKGKRKTSQPKGPTKKAKVTSGPNIAQPTQTAQGVRTIRTASDQYGCNHSGLLDLVCMTKADLTFFVKDTGWLYNTPCKDCAGTEPSATESDNRILDMKSLLDKGNRAFGFYCNCGPTAHKMKHDDPDKSKYTCDLVLCPGCKEKRELNRSSSTGGGKRQRAKAQWV
jgi:hypothetical protein